MAYTPVTWKNREDPTFDSGTDPAITADNLNRIETGISDAHDHMENEDLHFTAAERTKLEGIETGATAAETDYDNYTETLSFEENDWILIQSTTDGTIKKIRAGNLLR